MESGLLTFAYLTASVLFILSLRGLSSQETARQGNLYGMLGMVVAVLATASAPQVTGYAQIGIVMTIAVVLGAVMAIRVAMTGMPELVAILHSFVGLAAVLVGLAAYYDATEPGAGGQHGSANTILLIEIFIDVLIGAITFTGSVIAWGKLRGSITGRALVLPGRHLMNLALFIGCIVCAVWLVQAEGRDGLQPMLITIGLAGLLGIHLVMAIGGADMPVVVSMLNSYSGWTAAAAGFMLSNDLLIITGALVGSSGAILSIIMCRAMNRSIVSVMLGGFGAETGKPAKAPSGPAVEGEVSEVDVEGMVALLRDAKDVMIIPGVPQ